MTNRQVPKIFIYLSVVLVVVGSAMVLLNKKKDNDISISEPVFDCNYENKMWNCSVEFNLENTTHHYISGSLSMRGVTYKARTKTTQVIISDATNMKYELDGYQNEMFTRIIKTKKKPVKINITVVNKAK